MPGTARERLAELLGEPGELGEQPAWSVYQKLFMTDLSVTVDGVGPLHFPVSEEQSARLRGLGRRARFGRGEQTLTDPEIRDTWEIPKELVHIEWAARFGAVLEVMRDELGLPSDCELTADLHSMLLYETGQFFATHQDSEKDDSMVGTLVVTLPSDHTGGELVIEHRGRRKEYRGSKVAVSLVAFYADCHHQVLPVTTGNRITLTYNLLLTGDSGAAAQDAAAQDTLTGELAACLDEHFATPITLSYGRGQADPPMRLAYLLDHEYTARGLNWSRLKGSDAARAALLRAAANLADCEITLALAEIQETWNAYGSDDEDSWYGDHYDDEDDYGEDAEDGSDDAADDERYVLQDLIDSSITLAHWVSPGGGRPEEISLTISDAEVAATTPTADLTPHASQYEGYMGNYGNTLDRWYRRAALVIWPQSLDFASRAQASSGWAIDALDEMIRAGEAVKAREAARSLERFWNASVRSAPHSDFLGRTLETVKGLDDTETAAMLLRPFQLEQLAPGHAPALAALAAHYGDTWIAGLLHDWSAAWRAGGYSYAPEPLEWLTGLPRLCTALLASGSEGTATAHRILDLSWKWLADGVRPMLTGPSTSRLETWLTGRGVPLAGIITAAAQTGSASLLDDIVKLGQTGDDQVISLVMAALRAAEPHSEGFGELALGCAERIRGVLTRPQRAPDDWSIELPAGCACDLCGTLGAFLRDPERRAFEWPLAQEKRRHVHSRIDGAELPVRHETRRQGRPYTLVLTKTEALFERERLTRERGEADLAWLTKNWKVPL
ncbi:2OG-Fe(II) oxygenase [Microtetraspora fusca]|uniref:2OG-Fe(II) oxygenase n=1 Tax=Microtetraspora fusca TaxID=1997 RepID=UPI0008340732|nr:2OG-Fe(II) oxygenase [Microtetraspora fusca]